MFDLDFVANLVVSFERDVGSAPREVEQVFISIAGATPEPVGIEVMALGADP